MPAFDQVQLRTPRLTLRPLREGDAPALFEMFSDPEVMRYWSTPHMDEGLDALLRYGFEKLNLNRVEADIDPRNTRSAQSLLRLGFKHEGHLRERWVVDGQVSSSDLYGLLHREWLAHA